MRSSGTKFIEMSSDRSFFDSGLLHVLEFAQHNGIRCSCTHFLVFHVTVASVFSVCARDATTMFRTNVVELSLFIERFFKPGTKSCWNEDGNALPLRILV